MLKRWDTRVYGIDRLLEVYDSLSLNLDSMDIPRPKVYDLDVIIKKLIIKVFEGLSLRSAELKNPGGIMCNARSCGFTFLGKRII